MDRIRPHVVTVLVALTIAVTLSSRTAPVAAQAADTPEAPFGVPLAGTDVDGGSTVVFEAANGLFARRHDVTGEPIGAAFRLSPTGEPASDPALSTGELGTISVVWDNGGVGLARLLGSEG